MNHEPSFIEMMLTQMAFGKGKDVYEAFAENLMLAGNENVLDFGSGQGAVAGFVAPKLSGGHLTCADISKRWLSVCRKHLKKFQNVSFVQGNIDEQNLPKGSFDVVYSHFALQDIPDDELAKMIPALAELLKSKGRWVIREPLKDEQKINVIKNLLNNSPLKQVSSRILDIPNMGQCLENVYLKK